MINPVKRRHNRDNLILACAALRSVEAFPFFGTLLGLTREKDIIKNDDDVDLYVDLRHRETVGSLLEGAGFIVAVDGYPNLTAFFLQATRNVGGIETFVDIYFYENKDEFSCIIDRWNFRGTPDLEEEHLYLDKKLIFPLQEQNVFGHNLFMPKKPASCCKYLYGRDWKEKISKSKGEYKVVIHEHRPTFIRKEELAFVLLAQRDDYRREIERLQQAASALFAERDQIAMQRDHLLGERDRLVIEHSQLLLDRDNLATERDQIITEREHSAAERDELEAERDRVAVRHSGLVVQFENLTMEKSQLATQCEQLMAELGKALGKQSEEFLPRELSLDAVSAEQGRLALLIDEERRLSERVLDLLCIERAKSSKAMNGRAMFRLPMWVETADRAQRRQLRAIGFDSHFYYEVHPDVRVSGADALDHYVRHGRAEGRHIRLTPPDRGSS